MVPAPTPLARPDQASRCGDGVCSDGAGTGLGWAASTDCRTRGADLKRWRSGSKDGRSLLERFAFSFMGPPQLGQHTVREGYVPDAAALLCHRCSEPWEVHERVHTGSMTYRRCPTPPD